MNLKEIKSRIRVIRNIKDVENIKEILSFEDLGEKIKEVLDSVSELDDSLLDFASQQIIGFKHGKWNRDNIIGLIDSMGLTGKEWNELKENYPIDSDLEESEIQEIDDYFKNK